MYGNQEEIKSTKTVSSELSIRDRLLERHSKSEYTSVNNLIDYIIGKPFLFEHLVEFTDYIMNYPGCHIIDAYNTATNKSFCNVEEPRKSHLLALYAIINEVAVWRQKLKE